MKPQNDHNETKKNKVLTSKELSTKTQNRGKKIVKSLLRDENQFKTRGKILGTYRDERSPLFNQLENFLPKLNKSTVEIMNKEPDEREKMDIENVDDCNEVIEMNIFLQEVKNEEEDSSSSDSDSSDDSEDKNDKVIRPQSLLIVKKKKKSVEGPPQKKLICEVEPSDSICNSSKEKR